MKLVIDIPEEIYKVSQILDVKYEDTIQIPLDVIVKGTPIEEKQTNTAEWKEKFRQEIEIANKDIDLMPEQEDYMRGYLGGILCAYRIVFGKNYDESEDKE